MAGDKVLVFGATGPAGICLLRELLFRNHPTIAYIRNPSKVPNELAANPLLEIVKGEIDDVEALSFAVAKSFIILSLLGPSSLTALPDPSIYSDFYARLFPLMRQHGVKRIMAMSTPSAGQPEDRFHLLMTLLILLVRFIAPKAYQAVRGIANVFKEQARGLDWIVYRIAGIPGASDEEAWKKGRESGGVHAGYVGDGTWSLTTNRSALARWLVDAVEDEEGMRDWIGKLPAVCGLSASKAKIT
ncbi:hypothetical protein DL764_005783 [Monosporascus ibericus]|uniref:NAD(P)-binding domain-containing protein n=1 Tax=Monosporascus ibericus TaxID=155417 RepID=A0A4V1XAF2_9PEZI|nr:hypothetical protein DL764_005783 [Monosporascus ibericus]